jgi:hypothetical protein
VVVDQLSGADALSQNKKSSLTGEENRHANGNAQK